jgi:large subunit ribosomal protein L23
VLRPHQTEKASRLESEGVYTFIVDRRATKPAVRREIEARYRVKVRRVRIIQRRALVVRQGGRITRRRPAIKKALVTLEKGYRIEAESSS